MKLVDALKKESIIPNLTSRNKVELIRELSERVTSVYPNMNTERVFNVLMEREKLCSTAVDEGVAIPHGKLSGISNVIAAFGRSKEGIDFDSLDGNPTHLFILLLAPENSAGMHIKLLAKISRVFKIRSFRSLLMEAKSRDEIYEIIAEEDDKH
ncbi:MAG TPA: PTS sugar transporter subunit IIA [Thermodesulfobacteriota bacterium]|nr:PTS sugar transporter subunit IIA [Thermodesulfobacteriota bacterium]